MNLKRVADAPPGAEASSLRRKTLECRATYVTPSFGWEALERWPLSATPPTGRRDASLGERRQRRTSESREGVAGGFGCRQPGPPSEVVPGETLAAVAVDVVAVDTSSTPVFGPGDARRWRTAKAVAAGASGEAAQLADATLGSQRTRRGRTRRPPDSVSTEARRRADP
jgi:hypothetical protein